jgi:EpsI family protein
MNTTFTRFLPVAVLGFGVLLISGMREQYVVPPILPMVSIPATMNGLVGKNMVIAEEERRVAGMSDYILREYGRDSTTLFSVYVGYYDRQVQGKTIHSPKNCLPGAGWEVMSAEQIAAPGLSGQGTTNRVLLANKGVRALVYYWYQGRGRIEANEYKVKWNLLRDAAALGRTEEALVRIVVPMVPTSRAATAAENKAAFAVADSIAQSVAKELLPAVSKVLPALQTASAQ